MSRILPTITLAPLTPDDRERFIRDNQEAFRYGACEEFGMRDDHVEEDGEIISRATIEHCIDAPDAEALRIFCDGRTVGGAVVKPDPVTGRGVLDLFFTAPAEHGRGIGQAAWFAIEARYPAIRVWETCTPHFDTRNLHFYINRCGFHAVEFYCPQNPDPNPPEDDGEPMPDEGPDLMFRFEKVLG